MKHKAATPVEPEELERDPESGVIVAKYGDDAGALGSQKHSREVDTVEYERVGNSGRLVKKLRSARKVESVLDRMLRTGSIDEQMHACGEKYARCFHKAHAVSSVTLFEPTIKGSDDIFTEELLNARASIDEATKMVGGERSITASCLWFVIGWGESLNTWAARQAKPLNERVAAGILIGALATLAGNNYT